MNLLLLFRRMNEGMSERVREKEKEFGKKIWFDDRKNIEVLCAFVVYAFACRARPRLWTQLENCYTHRDGNRAAIIYIRFSIFHFNIIWKLCHLFLFFSQFPFLVLFIIIIWIRLLSQTSPTHSVQSSKWKCFHSIIFHLQKCHLYVYSTKFNFSPTFSHPKAILHNAPSALCDVSRLNNYVIFHFMTWMTFFFLSILLHVEQIKIHVRPKGQYSILSAMMSWHSRNTQHKC